jgi:2-aminoadipate transaminase
VSLSLPRRRRLVEIAAQRELLVLEDSPYGLLRYEGDAVPPLYALDDTGFVMHLGTFSKILSPGIRIGWVAAPKPVLAKINLGKQAADLCTSTLSQVMVQAYFHEARWRDYVDSLTDLYRGRRDTLLGALADHFPPQAEWTSPAGGLFVWATLPDFIDTTDLLARALRENVAFVPGAAAYLDGRGRNSMRLNFSGSTDADLREGVRRIGEVITEQVELYGTLTGRPGPAAPPVAETVAVDEPEGAQVLPLPRRDRDGRRTAGS